METTTTTTQENSKPRPILRPLYRELASLLQARANCARANNDEWYDKHAERIETLVKQWMPSGSGIDTGTEIDFDASTPSKLVFVFSYHHMDENGYYNGWTDHKCIVRPSLAFGIDIRISGRDRNMVKDYLYEVYHHAITTDVVIY